MTPSWLQRASALALLVLVVSGCGRVRVIPTRIPSPTATGAPARIPTMDRLAQLGGEPCAEADEFVCVTLDVPLDHFGAGAGAGTLGVTFAVRPAEGERRGTFVTAVGGPGGSGLAVAADYTAAFDPGVVEQFDIVFFDQRGVGASGGIQCPQAAADYYRTEADPATPEGRVALLDSSRAFAEACAQEMGPAEHLPYLGTRQAVEDLEVFRQAMGDDRFWLYGESYGTQYAQTYAAAHPDRLAGLILDGTVDLTISGAEFLAESAQAFHDTLVATLKACSADEACAADAGGDALAVYDDLAARLQQTPIPFGFPLPSGGVASRSFTLADLETAASGYLYSEATRMLLQRGMAAAARGDLVPLARLLYDTLGLDPETLDAIPDPSYSDAAYYAVECSDYEYFDGTPEERGRAYLLAGEPALQDVPRLASVFYGDLPCVFWPSRPDPRPAPLFAAGIPTLVLGASADPATPVDNGRRVFHRLAAGYLVTVEGGAHVVFGRGDACPDDIVTEFLLEGRVPDSREQVCPGVVADDYVPLAPADASDFADVLEALISAETEIQYLPEYFYWDAETPTSVGCPFGGTLRFEPNAAGDGDHFSLLGCAFSAGFILTGAGDYRWDDDYFTFDLQVDGLAPGSLAYVRQAEEQVSATGVYAGEAVALSR